MKADSRKQSVSIALLALLALASHAVADGREATAGEVGSGVYFEAEWAQQIKLNYQIEHCGERSTLMADEGADGAFAWLRRDHALMDVGTARYELVIPKAGRYRLWALRYWMDSCGNSVAVAFNDQPFRTCSTAEDRRPDGYKKWEWGRLAVQTLPAGPATVTIRVMEDGPRFDRFALLPLSQAPDAKAAAAAAPFFSDRAKVSFAVSVSLPTQVVGPDNSLALTAYVRKLIRAPAEGTLSFAGPEGARLAGTPTVRFRMDEGQALSGVPLTIRFPDDLPRREHRIKLLVSDSDGKVCALQSFTVTKPLNWSVLGPLHQDDHLEESWGRGTRMALDRSVETRIARDRVKVEWAPYPYTGYDRYATMNFEQVWGRMRKARCAYVYTRVASPSDQKILLLVNNDDRASVWVNGHRVYHDTSASPAIGGLCPVVAPLRMGTNSILARIDQDVEAAEAGKENYWRLRVRLRNINDKMRLADVVGM